MEPENETSTVLRTLLEARRENNLRRLAAGSNCEQIAATHELAKDELAEANREGQEIVGNSTP
jgi:hypothetical protein